MSETVAFKHKLGVRVRDTVSGMEGIINARAQSLNGCIRYTVQPPVEKDKTTMPDSFWVDEQQIEVLDNGVLTQVKQAVGRAMRGGPVERIPAARAR
jgi:hypothetical protein